MSDLSKVQVGDVMTFTHWGRVIKVDTTVQSIPQLVVEDLETGLPITIKGDNLIKASASADQFITQERATKTRAAELLIASHNKPLTVCFTKQNGEERIIRGKLTSAEPLLGRSMVEDLDIKHGTNRLRQVDHRTIKWLIVDGVQYTVK